VSDKVVSLEERRRAREVAEAPRERFRYDLVEGPLDVGLLNDELVALILNEDSAIAMSPESAEKVAARLLEVAKVARKNAGR